MKKLSYALTILMTMFFLVSFNHKTENTGENPSAPLPELDFLKKLKIMPLPYRDSTNFDNHIDKPQMRQTEIEQLKLKSKIPDGFGFTLNHKLNISPQFHAVAVSYQLSDETLYTALITYDKNYNIIDMLEIAFDETAESWSRIESTVYTDHITVDDIHYGFTCVEIETTDYKIESDGTFTSLPAIAPDAIVTMTTTSEMVDLRVEWTGCGSIIANGVILTDEPETANMIPAAADGSVALTTKGDAQLIGLTCTHNSLTALDVTKCPTLEYLMCYNNSLTVLDITNCPKLEYLSAKSQELTLPVVRIDGDKLSIKNPVSFNGIKVDLDWISDDGTYDGDSITWVRERESGMVSFDFTTKLPDGITGDPFSAIQITQPWTKNKPSEKMPTSAQTPIVTMTTANDSVVVSVKWTGSGNLIANGVELKNDNIKNTIFPSIDGLITLTTTGDVRLTQLNCNSNSLKTLDVTNCTELTKLECAFNSLSALDITKCTKLTELDCKYNNLSGQDITNCPELAIPDCTYSTISALDISNCPKLKELHCGSNKLGVLDVTTCPELTVLNCSNISLKVLDLSNCPKLISLNCYYNPLYDLDVTKCAMLKILNCSDDSLRTLDVTKCPMLTELDCSDNLLRILDVTQCPMLTELNCYDNSLRILDVTQCPMLTELNCSDNSLNILDVTQCSMLTKLNSFYNKDLNVLDVTQCAMLTELNCSYNSLTVLDVTKCPVLTLLKCDNNSLKALDVTNCRKLTKLECQENSLSALDVTKCTELTKLECEKNSLSTLDVTKCTELTSLSCGNNSLPVLDVAKCTKLTGLWCRNNSLSALDVSKCQKLTGLGCNDNSLMVLDITKCPKLKYLNANNQTPKLPIVKPDDDTKLSIKNPVMFAGAEVSIENINYGGTYTNGIITWLLSGESGEAAFQFTAKLPDGFEGESFSGIFIQPWTKK